MKGKWLPGDKTVEYTVDQMLRVDHSGECGAKKIYLGQIASMKFLHYLKTNQSNNEQLSACINTLTEMYEQECVHHDYFVKMISTYKVRPSFFLPMWSLCGWFIGFISSLLGKKAAMACTVAVEDVISLHYENQLISLRSLIQNSACYKYDSIALNELYEKISTFRKDEIEHLNIGINNDAEKMLWYSCYTMLVKLITHLAIVVAKKI